MRYFTKRALALLASGLLITTAHAQVGLESVTFDGELPELELFAFFESGNAGFESDSAAVSGIPKFDPALGTLVDMLVSFNFEYAVDSFLYSEGIFDGGIPHQVFASMAQRVIGVTYLREDGVTAGLVDFDGSFSTGCFGEPFGGDGCTDEFSFISGFGAADVSLIDDLAMDAIVGEGDVDIFGLTIDNIDVFFDLNNIGAAFWEVYTQVLPGTTSFSVTYVYDSGVSEPDTDEDGVIDSMDSCIDVPNADQVDTDGDGFGNACDADINNDCVVNVIDLGALRGGFFGADPTLDFNGDGLVNVIDLGILRLAFFDAPGPSGLTSICD